MKPATNRLSGLVVELERRADLLDQPVVHDDDLVGHGHGLDLVVGDIDRRGLEPLVQFLDLGAHLHAQLGVEVRQRLVEQEDLRIAHDGAAHGDALALAAGELARKALQIRSEAEDFGGALHARVDLGFRRAAQLAAKSPCWPRPSCADRARSSGTPSRCRVPSAARCSPRGRRCGFRREVMFSRPATMRSKVDLPQPDGPTSTTNSPSRIEISTPWMTGVEPKALRTSRIATDAIHSPGGARRHTVAFRRQHVAAALMKSRANAITQARL